MRVNYYQVLGIPSDASKKVIKAAYLHKAKRFHPDLSKPEEKIYNTEQFKLVSESYNTLIDNEKRREYDSCFLNKRHDASDLDMPSYPNTNYYHHQYRKSNGSYRTNTTTNTTAYTKQREESNVSMQVLDRIWPCVIALIYLFYVREQEKASIIVPKSEAKEENPSYGSYVKPANLPSRVSTSRTEYLEHRKKMRFLYYGPGKG